MGVQGKRKGTNLLVLVPVGSVALFGTDVDSSAAYDSAYADKQVRLEAVWLGDVCYYHLQACPRSRLEPALYTCAPSWSET